MLTITVRQTQDPYIADIQYIAYSKIILPENASLSLNNIGVGQPGNKFIVMHQEEMCVPDVYHQSFPPGAIERIICYEAELDPFLTVVVLKRYMITVMHMNAAVKDSVHRNGQSRVGSPT
ncbi:hypothetical protein D9615_008954 [Tricholomella constricta]|uniref:Uncharacterized protein n=1 Tax=Tricholomella constricta TaxID=117010 RepID=A0A8H5H0Z8_9AGAR|nr:hypothetical protein D9615_008954 [Tricholomella constricta]